MSNYVYCNWKRVGLAFQSTWWAITHRKHALSEEMKWITGRWWVIISLRQATVKIVTNYWHDHHRTIVLTVRFDAVPFGRRKPLPHPQLHIMQTVQPALEMPFSWRLWNRNRKKHTHTHKMEGKSFPVQSLGFEDGPCSLNSCSVIWDKGKK